MQWTDQPRPRNTQAARRQPGLSRCCRALLRLAGLGGILLSSISLGARAGVEKAAPAPLDHAAERQANPTPEVVRVLQDPGARAIWLLERNPLHPGGPGLLHRVEMPDATARPLQTGSPDRMPSDPLGRVLNPPTVKLFMEQAMPAVRAGDQVRIEQHSTSIDAVFVATALSPARVGATFDVQLTAGGRRVRAIALASGLARLADPTKNRLLRFGETPRFGETQ